MKGIRIALRAALTALLCLGSIPGRAEDPPPLGAVATQHPLATEAAARVLREGGNAIDASIAAALTLGVVEPYHSGLGGGGMALVWVAKTGKVYAIDFRETAPLRARADMYQGPGLGPEASQVGPLAIAVPGEPAGLGLLHERWGKLSWASLFTEAVRFSEQGFPADAELQKRVLEKSDCLSRDYNSAQIYQNLLAAKGAEPFRQPALAETLKKLRDRGVGDFYRGETSRLLVESLRGKGACLETADLASYRAVERPPLHSDFAFGRLWGMPPPSSGGISVLRGMNLLEAWFRKHRQNSPAELAVELVRDFGVLFKERNAAMGDPDFVKTMPIHEWLKKSDGSTSHLSVIDREGNAVAMTMTINLSFGSCVTAGPIGVMMNDEMDDFSTNPGQPNAFGLVQSENNAIAPGKRPLSSMSPTLLTKDRHALLAIGSPGGPRIITSVLQSLVHYLFLHEDLAASLAAARLHYQVEPPTVFGESEQFFSEIREQLKLATKLQLPWGNVEAVAYDPAQHRFTAASDPRAQGKALVVEGSSKPTGE